MFHASIGGAGLFFRWGWYIFKWEVPHGGHRFWWGGFKKNHKMRGAPPHHNVIYVASISAHFLIFSLQISLGDFNLLAIIPHHQIFSIIWCIWNITPQFLFLYNELRAASRLNFVTMIQKRQKWYNKTLYMKQTNISIIKTYKSENKSTKFYLEFMLEKTLASR